jgi:hypothetical protein
MGRESALSAGLNESQQESADHSADSRSKEPLEPFPMKPHPNYDLAAKCSKYQSKTGVAELLNDEITISPV